MSELPHPVTGTPYPSPVPPGTGWPDDPATSDTPVAESPSDVHRLVTNCRSAAQKAAVGDQTATPGAAVLGALRELGAEISVCRACPRLVGWREDVARDKRASYAGEPYWGRPIPGWGDESPRVLIVGLAPAANGGNRTGRIFTGDRSGDWLFASLHRVGLASRPDSVHAGDGQRLIRTRMVAAVRCAPPDNKPTTAGAGHLRAVGGNGAVAGRGRRAGGGLSGVLRVGRRAAGAGAEGFVVPRPKPRFGHGVRVPRGEPSGDTVALLGCYHPSQQNTFTGRLTEPMLDAVLGEAARLAEVGPYGAGGAVEG